MPADVSGAFDFHLFVSYSHRQDSRLVRRIEPFLESFHKRVPRGSRDRLTPLALCVDGSDFKLPPRSQPDAGNGAGSNDVPNVILRHLDRSRELLVLCSEAARQSPWVNQEIAWFVQHRGPGSIRLALTEGADPLAEPERYFAPLLVEHALHKNICYDLRGHDQRRAREWSRVADIDRELVRLAADLNGLAAGDVYPLWLEEERRRTRRLAAAAAAAAVLIGLGGGFGLYQRSTALVAERDKLAAQADEKVARAETARKESERQAADERRKAEEAKREAADANARTQSALRLASDAFERLYRNPLEALSLASSSRELEASTNADRAIADAYRVAILRNENRRQAMQLIGSGPSYLASRWSTSNLTSVISADGRYLVVITPRGRDGVTGPDGKPMPGELYLINNETQRPIQLDNCRADDSVRRVESVSFDIEVRQVFVTRQYNLMAYSLTGDCLGVVKLECCTKSPIHLVEGYFGDRHVLAADSKGGLWMADPKTGAHVEIRSEWSRDTVASIVVSPDHARAIVISESGRATILSPAARGRPTEIEIVKSGALAAAFHPHASDVFAIAGADGLAAVWRLAAERPAPAQRFSIPDVTIDTIAFTSDGKRLAAIADDLRLYVLETGTARPVADLAYPIEWLSSRKVPNSFEAQKPGRFERPAAGVRIADIQRPVRSVETIGGATWILTSDQPEQSFSIGPAFVIEGDVARPIPDEHTDVSSIEYRRGSTWIHTTDGLYQLTAQGQRLVLPRGVTVVTSVDIGSATFFGTNRGAWRIEGNSVERVARTDTRITGIAQIDGTIFFASDSGVFRLDAPDRLLRITDEAMAARRVSKIGGDVWVLTGSESEPGPALRVRGLWARVFPGPTAGVHDVIAAGGATWLLAEGGLYRVDRESSTRIDGISRVESVREVASQVVAFQPALLGPKPAFVVRGDRAVPDAGLTAGVNAGDGQPATRSETIEGARWEYLDGGACLVNGGRKECFKVPQRTVNRVRRVDGRWWLLTGDGITTGPAYRIDEGRPRAIPDEQTHVSNVHFFAGATWLVTTVDGYGFKPGPLVRVN